MTTTDEQPTTRRLAGGSALLLTVRAGGLVMGLAVSLLLARGLGKSALGTFTTGLVLVQIGSMLTDVGLSALLVREGAGAPTLRAVMLKWATRVRVVAGIVMFIVLIGVTFVTVSGTRERLAVICVISAVPLTAYTLGMTLLQQQLLLKKMSLLLLAQSILWLVIVGALFALEADLLAYAVAFVAYNAAYGVLVHRVSRRTLSGPTESMTLRQFSRLMREAVPLSATFVLVTLYYKLDALFVYRFAGAAAAGSYAIAFRFLDQLAIVPVTLGNIFLPLMARRHHSGQPAQQMFDRYTRITLVLCTPIVGIGMIMARPLVSLFGPDYSDAVLLLRLLLPAFIIVAFGYAVVHVAIVAHHSKKQFVSACLGLAINVALNVAFVPRYGARAAAIATVLTEGGVVASLYISLRRPCGLALPWRWLLRLAVVLTASSAAALLLRSHTYLSAFAFTAIYMMGVVALSVVDLGEIRSLLRQQPPSEPPVGSADSLQQPADLVPEVMGTER